VILTFAALVEVGAGLALIVAPTMIVGLLLGVTGSGGEIPLARFLGIALLALGLACWLRQQRVDSGAPALRGMLIYNLLVALYLTYLGTIGHLGGMLLWPAAGLHACVALLLIWWWRGQRLTKTG
jgi:hypothetical protein